jgi:myo-inositol 2-dehydrogenase / D-chiro-inositol 1-dehydrogenase
MRIAVIGTGRIGQIHAEALAAEPGVTELVVADVDERCATETARRLGVTAMPVDDAVQAADAIVIAAVTSAHADLIRAGLARRIPIFCEKPLAIDLAATYRLVEEIEAVGSPFQLGFQRRFDSAYREARRLVAEGSLGTLYAVHMTAFDRDPPPEHYIPTSGGFFRDAAIHDFDAIRWLTGDEVATIHADGEVRALEAFRRHGDVDTAACILRMRSGVLGVLGGGRNNPRGYDIRMELVGSADAVAIGLSDRTPIRPLGAGAWTMGAGWTGFTERFAQAYRDELRAFVEVARGRAPSACTARDGLEAMRVAEAATRSRAERRKIEMSEITPGAGGEGGVSDARDPSTTGNAAEGRRRR